jgi:hypothetical protein
MGGMKGGKNPISQPAAMPTFDEAERSWSEVPEARQHRVVQWVNRWREVRGGFSVYPDTGLIEPSRLAHPSDGRNMRRRVDRLIAELRGDRELADDVWISTIRVWYCAQLPSGGATVQ